MRKFALIQILLLWLSFIGLTAAAAHLRRADWQQQKAKQLVTRMEPQIAHIGGWYNVLFYWRSKALYLLDVRGVDSPGMERLLLLYYCAARQKRLVSKAKYSDWPLHSRLIEKCLEHYPDDPLVLYAAGHMSYHAGEYDQALECLEALQDKEITRLAWVSSETTIENHINTLLLFDRVAAVEEYLQALEQEHPWWYLPKQEHLRLLYYQARYNEALEYAKQQGERYSSSLVASPNYAAALVRLGMVDEYRRLLQPEIDGITYYYQLRYIHLNDFWEVQFSSSRINRLSGSGISDETAWQYIADPHLAVFDGNYDVLSALLQDAEAVEAQCLGDVYCVNRDAEVLSEIELRCAEVAAELEAALAAKQPDQEQLSEIEAQRNSYGTALVQCLIADGDWETAIELNGSLGRCAESLLPQQQENSLLCALAAGKDISGMNIRWLTAGGKLPELVLSERFAAALEYGGLERETALAGLRSAAQPWRPDDYQPGF